MVAAAEIAWRDDEIALMKRLWADGLSGSDIVRELWRQLRTQRSRGAVHGYISRHRTAFLPRKPHAAAPKRVRAPRPEPRARPVVRFPPLRMPRPSVADAYAYDAASRHVPLVDLEAGDCRFPVNHAAAGEPHLFCGARREPGCSYCAHHAARASGRYSADEVVATGEAGREAA